MRSKRQPEQAAADCERALNTPEICIEHLVNDYTRVLETPDVPEYHLQKRG
ncbi:MAG: hypothetical protein ACAI35_10300 [Candidatus Methylacidiphilales bacterium]|nr:hypothetical protein [Candidatus Methylacidiphilales bacterium]